MGKDEKPKNTASLQRESTYSTSLRLHPADTFDLFQFDFDLLTTFSGQTKMRSKMTSPASIYSFLLLVLFAVPALANDWAEWRGPARDGISLEKGLPAKWSPTGDNAAWKAPYGGRSAPIVVGNHLYLQNTAGKGEQEQERVMCFNADTGKLIWEHRFNVYLSDVPPHRVGWASPVGDPQTGNVYVFGVGGTLLGFNKDGSLGAFAW